MSKINTKEYLDENLFGIVRKAMRNVLNYTQTSGELDKYWLAVDKKNEVARKAARRVERERKRVEIGSAYQSSDEEDMPAKKKVKRGSNSSSSYYSESEEGEQE